MNNLEHDRTGQWQMVESTNIEAIAFKWKIVDKGSLHIRFRKNGKHYVFQDVPTSVYNALMDSESVGKTFHEIVKNKYDFYIKGG